MDSNRYSGGHFKPLFQADEYVGRVVRAKKEMESRGLDLLMVCDPSNMNWLTGYDGISYYVPQCVVVAESLAEPLWIGRPMDAGGALKTTWLKDDSILSWPESSIHRTDDHPLQHIMSILRERHLLQCVDGKTVQLGLEMDHDYFTARALREIERSIKTHTDVVNIVDASMLVNWLRLVKSDAELEIMRRAAEIANATMTAALERIAVGVRQCDVIGDAIKASVCGTAYAGEFPALGGFMLATGSDAMAAHLTYTDEQLLPNRGSFFELCGSHRRYHCPIARTVFLGEPPSKFKTVETAVGESMTAALSAAIEGNTAEQVWEAFYAILNGKYGYTKVSRLGYSIGIGYSPDWGEHTVSIRPGDKTVLRKNMCFHFIAGMWMDDWGYELSEAIIIAGDRQPPECLHTPARKLFIKSGDEPAAKKSRSNN